MTFREEKPYEKRVCFLGPPGKHKQGDKKPQKTYRMRAKNEDPQRIGRIVEEVLSEKGYLSVCKEYSILLNWPSIVDKKFAEASICERIENGIVYVKVSSAPWRQEAVYRKETLLKRIQKEFDCPSIKDIVFY
jgi:hypothetical protein